MVDGALQPSAAFSAPLFGRPGDLVTFAADAPKPAWAAAFSAARRLPGGDLVPYPDRATIEAEAASFRPVAWVRDRVEAFLIQVQGSARVRLPDGRLLRLTYAGRNGHPYTSVGRLLIERGAIAPARHDAGAAQGVVSSERTGARRDRPCIARCQSLLYFFRGDTGRRWRRADRRSWGGIDTASLHRGRPHTLVLRPALLGSRPPSRGRDPSRPRSGGLMIAQDTGSAIVGPARLDIFFGSGDDAGARAGDIRHPGTPHGAAAEIARVTERPRRSRLLSDEEIDLWLTVARTVVARSGAMLPAAKPKPMPPAPPKPDPVAPARGVAPPGKPPAPSAPPLAPFEKRYRQKVTRGRVEIEGRDRPARHESGRGAPCAAWFSAVAASPWRAVGARGHRQGAREGGLRPPCQRARARHPAARRAELAAVRDAARRGAGIRGGRPAARRLRGRSNVRLRRRGG